LEPHTNNKLQAQLETDPPPRRRPFITLTRAIRQRRQLPINGHTIDLPSLARAGTPLNTALLPEQREVISVDRLTTYARSLVTKQQVALYSRGGRDLGGRLAAAAHFLATTHAALQAREPVAGNSRPAGADRFLAGAEWLLDNYYIITDQIREIRVDLPRRYYAELPKLTNGPLAGYPRIYALARALVAYTDSRLDQERITQFVAAYQQAVADEAPLTLGELWSVPIMLRLSLVETLAHLVSLGRRLRIQYEEADHWADRLLNAADMAEGQEVSVPPDLARVSGVTEPAFAARLYTRVRDHGAPLAPVLGWIDARLAEAGSNPEEILRHDHRQQATLIASIGSTVTSMRRISAIDWASFVESLSATEQQLRRDPAEIYGQMDFATRDRYRHVIERLARHAEMYEQDVAAQAIELAGQARTEGAGDRRAHVGYYLLDSGRSVLEAALNYRPTLVDGAGRFVQAHATPMYVGLIGGTTAAFVAATLALVRRYGAGRARQLVTAASTALPAGSLAVSLVNHVLTTIMDPYVLPKLDLKAGIPATARTFVVIPVLLTGPEQVREMLEHLQVLYLANHDPHLHYAILSDFPDAESEEQPGEADLVRQAAEGVSDVNRRYGGDHFYLFHRRRRWNPEEGIWMGWERKRGKLLEFNRLLRGAGGDDYTTRVGDLSILPQVKYVITLDADTQLPPGSAARLIGTLAHPLNWAELDSDQRVVRGYGILQPRTTVTATSAAASPFARIFAGHTGVDPYTTAISDVYQDLFHSGIYIGKGIYDVDAFEAAVDGRFPENTLLSHDLLEGIYARVGLVSDVAVFEDHPSRYPVYYRRQDRWLRGDWQILPWLFPRVPDATGARVRNPLPGLGRWQIFDNLRRSLEPLADLALFVAGWTILPGPPALWTVAGLLIRGFPLVTGLISGLPHKPAFTPWSRHLRFLLYESSINAVHTALTITLLPHQAYVHGRAIGRALTRMVLTHRRLLEWQTVAQSEQNTDNTLLAYCRRMWPVWLVDIAFVISEVWPRTARQSKVKWPILLAWAASPLVAQRISQPTRRAHRPLRAEEQAFLRRSARKTWRYFEDFIGPDDHWLAPDNYQEVPDPRLARRTSPTNLSLALLAALAARHFGYLSTATLADRLDHQLAGMERLERFRGHLYNWYDTATGEPLQPRYISTVDSTNLAAHLVVLKQGCLALAEQPIFGPETLTGLADTARLLREALEGLTDGGEIGAGLSLFENGVASAPHDALAWMALLDNLTGWADRLVAHVEQSVPAGADGQDVRYWAQALAAQAHASKQEAASLLGWIRHLADAPASVVGLAHELLTGEWVAGLGDESAAVSALPNIAVPTLAQNLTGCARRLPAIRHVRQAIGAAGLAPHDRDTALTWLEGLHDSLLASWTASEQLIGRLRDVGRRAEALSAGMRFDFLYDAERKLFVIGYNATEGRADNSYYDLLASEARLGSFLAVARGDVPAEHWFQLGRGLAPVAGSQALLSWTGTMFEYLMPNLVLPVYAATLLDQTSVEVVRRQAEYGREQGVPWGISESAFNLTDAAHNYQYRAFGVPGLGLKRGLEDDLVVAPYATMLALLVDSPLATANLRRLQAEGLDGRYGFYEAIDYTEGRTVPVVEPGPDSLREGPGREGQVDPRSGRPGAVVRNYMVHHQGMSLLALDNVLHDYPLSKAFLAEPMIQATDLLLQERIPLQAPLTHVAQLNEAGLRRSRLPVVPEAPGEDVIPFDTAFTPRPIPHLLSNGAYTVMLTNAGSGYSQWRNADTAPILVTRWQDDATRDHWGSFLYLRDLRSGRVWSAGYAPTGSEPEYYGGEWTPDRGSLWRRDDGIETRTTVVVSPEEDVEVRRLTVTNRSNRPREIEVTSYAEVVLAPASADLAHPAFQKLFVETEWVPGFEALLATRRPRSAKEHPPWLLHVAAVEGDVRGAVEYDTSRSNFLGRGHSPANPVALTGETPLSASTGAVLDPIVSLRYRVRLAPGETARLTFTTGVALTRDEAVLLAERYQDAAGGSRAIRLAHSYSRIALQQREMTPAVAMRAIRLAGRVLFPDPALRPPASVLARNTRGQPSLWAQGISGDLPIVLVTVSEPSEAPLIEEVVQAHNYWQSLGFAADLVILNEYGEGYATPVHDELRALLEHGPAVGSLDKPGGVFLRRDDSIPEEDEILLRTAARVVLPGRRGTLVRQLARGTGRSSRGRQQAAARQQQAATSRRQAAVGKQQTTRDEQRVAPQPGDPKSQIQNPKSQDNGLGGFSMDGREYLIDLAEGQWTPAPWSNVLANPEFGCLVSESTLGSTWWLNSRENRLTPWSNDPVSDPPGDVVYIQDAATGALWTPTPLPIRETEPYTVRHGQGYTVYTHTSHGITAELTAFVPPDASLRVLWLTLRNTGRSARQLRVTNYVEWVMGVLREPSARFVITAWDEEAVALVARNPYNNEFADRLAFLSVAVQGQTAAAGLSFTADRRTFLGRNGSPAMPAALAGADNVSPSQVAGLDRRVGAGLDPCGAVQVTMDLPVGHTAGVAFFLGEAADVGEMHALLGRFRAVEGTLGSAVEVALGDTRRLWDDLLGCVQVQTPDPAFDLLLNRWLLYQSLACRIWARSAFYQGGGAYGFRDQLQDTMAWVHAKPPLTREQIVRCAGRQFKEGDVQHWWHPPTGRGIRTRISDDVVWLAFVTAYYVEVTGDTGVLDEQVPFLEAPVLQPDQEDMYSTPQVSPETATVYDHCVRALLKGATAGPHDLPLMGTGDWNDGMNQVGAEGKGESVWLAWFLASTLDHFVPLAQARGDEERVDWCHTQIARLKAACEASAWDGAWYRRAYYDDGTPLGSHGSEDCQIDSIAQSWAVLSGAVDNERAQQAMASVAERLVHEDEGLVLLLTPPFDKGPLNPGYIKGYVPGIRENGGQYTHAATWVGFARAALQDTEGAYGLFSILNPVNHALDPAARDRYKVEPYVIAADVYSHAGLVGHGGWTWYTGSAAWFYRLGLEAILGLHRAGATLRLDPVIPTAWPGFTITYRYGRATYTIQVDNAAHTGRGVTSVTLDGVPYPAGSIPLADTPDEHQVVVRLGG
jgi:cyclic beta-1,2-glucan synthetase